VKVRRLRAGQWAVIKTPLHVLHHGCVAEYVVASHEIALGVALALVEKPSRCKDPWLPERVAGAIENERELRAARARWTIGYEIPPEQAWSLVAAAMVDGMSINDESVWIKFCPACGHGRDHHLFGCCSALLTGRTDGKTCGCTREMPRA
jgi:hypothetical protein